MLGLTSTSRAQTRSQVSRREMGGPQLIKRYKMEEGSSRWQAGAQGSTIDQQRTLSHYGGQESLFVCMCGEGNLRPVSQGLGTNPKSWTRPPAESRHQCPNWVNSANTVASSTVMARRRSESGLGRKGEIYTNPSSR